jgi:nucleoside-diphosphate-sugar epimerase
MPSSIAGLAARIVEGVWKMFGIASQPPLTRFELSFVSMPRRYNIAAAMEELGYIPRISFEQGLLEMQQ